MPTSLGLSTFAAELDRAVDRLASDASAAGMQTPVPTCPGWTVRDLVAHQGMVHRWATGLITGDKVNAVAVEEAGLAAPDPVGWFTEGGAALRAALDAAPTDLSVRFFLPDAPRPRDAWARRQCHETTIHAVDAASARLGGAPIAAEVPIAAELAADGIDELLCGFLARPSNGLSADAGHVLSVIADDTGDAWTVELGRDVPLARRVRATHPDTRWTGTAAQLYLGLWNRGDEITESGTPLLARWSESMRVTWD